MRSVYGSIAHEKMKVKVAKILTKRGYSCFQEAILYNRHRIDVIGIKCKEKIGVECILNINEGIINNKLKHYLPRLTKLVFFISKSKGEGLKGMLEGKDNVEVWVDDEDFSYTSIQLSEGFKEKLSELGNKGESYEDIIKRLIKGASK